MSILFNRREALAMIAAAPAALAAQASQLPLKTSGLEHLGFTVPEPQKSAAFYGRIFDPQIFQEMSPPLRYYCRLGIGYVAFGGNATAPARIDHFCATVEDYRLEEMRAELKTHGLNLTGSAGFNAVTDPDGIRMQFMATPGGLLPTIIPSTRVTQDDAICEAVGLDHVVLRVSDVEKSAGYYRKFFGMETARDRTPERIWFTAARTRLGLEKMAEGQMPHIDRFGIRVAAFDRQAVTRKLGAIGVTVVPSTGGNVLRFRDLDGSTVELRGV
ncbi:MAG TPA: VOC family protein [Vicinamibacterales bacterium]|nr:VOC family protein [Vicinamibacterales bacterium]